MSIKASAQNAVTKILFPTKKKTPKTRMELNFDALFTPTK